MFLRIRMTFRVVVGAALSDRDNVPGYVAELVLEPKRILLKITYFESRFLQQFASLYDFLRPYRESQSGYVSYPQMNLGIEPRLTALLIAIEGHRGGALVSVTLRANG